MNQHINFERRLLVLLTLLSGILTQAVFAQCPTMDASLSVSDLTPEVGDDVVFTYNGSVPFCSSCSYIIDFGDGHVSGGNYTLPPGNILGTNVYPSAGIYNVQFQITAPPTCTDVFNVQVTVSNPVCPLPKINQNLDIVCLGNSYTSTLSTTPLGDYSITNVAWNMGDSPALINTSVPSITHTYTYGDEFAVQAQVTYTNSLSATCVRDAVYIHPGVSGIFGSQNYGKVRIFTGDPSFQIITDVSSGNDAYFYYQGDPFPDIAWQPSSLSDLWYYEFYVNSMAVPVATGDGLVSGDLIYTATGLPATGNFAELKVKWKENTCPDFLKINFDFPAQNCDTCNSFKPSPGDRYWISAWVKVENTAQVKTYNPDNLVNSQNVNPATLNEAYVELEFFGGATTAQFYPTDEIIDGWQRVVGEFTIPPGTYDMGINLYADDSKVTYFDDIRIHPFNASMKSYVYDGSTFWLVSELDDNNYATFYEYDQEGGLIRIKKETARGIVTIQETRSNTIKN